MQPQFPHDDCDDRTEEELFAVWANQEILRLKELLAAEKAERIVAELRAERAERALATLQANVRRLVGA